MRCVFFVDLALRIVEELSSHGASAVSCLIVFFDDKVRCLCTGAPMWCFRPLSAGLRPVRVIIMQICIIILSQI